MDNFTMAEFQHSLDQCNQRWFELKRNIRTSFEDIFKNSNEELVGMNLDISSNIITLRIINRHETINYGRLYLFIESFNLPFNMIHIEPVDNGDGLALDIDCIP